MHDIAPQQRIQPSAIDPFGRNGPGRGKLLADRGLTLVGQQQATQPAVRIGQRRGNRVMPIEPYSALRRI
jgi:hypothetical protein